MATQPVIKWYQCRLNENANDVVEGQLGTNTVDYGAIQAGKYSNVICVRPHFDSQTSIGKIRLWWTNYSASDPNSTTVNLPASQWVVKYYVSDCETYDNNMSGNMASSATPGQRCASMLNYANSTQQNRDKVTTTKQIDATITGAYSWGWCKSTWQNDTATKIAMQPVPFSWTTVAAQANVYQQRYQTSGWKDVVYTSASGSDSSTLLNYSMGGVLHAADCNVKEFVDSNTAGNAGGHSGFPYIFFTVKAPSTATAGTWSGWAFRMSYIWPYNTSGV